jgi:hypothetical protein
MVRQLKRFPSLALFLAAFLLVVLLPGTAPAGHPGNAGNPAGPVLHDPATGAGGSGGAADPADPDELGIYRMRQASHGPNSGPVAKAPIDSDRNPSAVSQKLLIVRAFLLGFWFSGV